MSPYQLFLIYGLEYITCIFNIVFLSSVLRHGSWTQKLFLLFLERKRNKNLFSRFSYFTGDFVHAVFMSPCPYRLMLMLSPGSF